jgi:hypothetical protein
MRSFRTLTALLPLVFLLCGFLVPVAMSASLTESSVEDCAGHDDRGTSCPCCPVEGMSVLDCLTICAGQTPLFGAPTFSLPVYRPASTETVPDSTLIERFYPPSVPPPIPDHA